MVAQILKLLFVLIVFAGLFLLIYKIIKRKLKALFYKDFGFFANTILPAFITVVIAYLSINYFLISCVSCGGDRSSSSRRENLKKLSGTNADELVRAKLAYHIPDTMQVGERYIADLSITKAMSNGVLLYGFPNKKIADFKLVDSILVSSRVMVSLIDPIGGNFYIKPVSTEQQLVNDKSNTVWKWYVVPTAGGENPLELKVSTQIMDKFGTDYLDIPVYSGTIKVKSNYWYSTKEFAGQNWQILLTAILIPLITFAYNLIKKQVT